MQIALSEAARLLQSRIAKDVKRMGCKANRIQLAAYVQRRFDGCSRSFITTEALRDKAIVELRPLDWDSKIYGNKIGVFTVFADPEEILSDPTLSIGLAEEVTREAKVQGIEMLVTRVGIAELAWIQALEEVAFQVMDVQCPLILCEVALEPGSSENGTDLVIRRFDSSDLPDVLGLAKEAFGRSHLYADVRLPVSLTDQLHEEWTKNDCGGRACFVLVAIKDRRIVGFVSGLWDQDQKDLLGIHHGHIDLIAVRSEARRLGVARRLMTEAIGQYRAKGAEVISVSTQGSNLAAIGLYQRLGFSLAGFEITLHGWLRF